MVEWQIKIEDSVIRLNAGKIVLSAPCSILSQFDFLNKIQGSGPFFELYNSAGEKYSQDITMIMSHHILNLSGGELKEKFYWWCESLSVDYKNYKMISDLIPSSDLGWREMTPEKKLALFTGSAIVKNQFSMLFLGELHLNTNAQEFLLNFLKGITDSTNHQLILFWSYRVQLSGTVQMSFGRRKASAA